ncbi:hypothetical protein [Bythopirellula polymerisocia]|uniref:Uncharacterized protein n=1 Tax=Bythopirellula polymerisocia TaxID=2528003 RepID=A0A5C6CUC9_9BACT|nr:hypothetical protein [Bythopirellula polymerisocia]TWU27465.1 hypothetical protein Pla144_22380 [Bythopirellula polymerisocia]
MIEKLMNLLGVHSNGNLDPVVRQVTEDCLAEVCQRVVGRTEGMNFSEARGYLRARATKIVLRRTRILIAKSPEIDSAQMSRIARLATERLVPQVLRQARVGVPAMPVYRQAA